MNKKVELFVYIDRCVYLNDVRVAGTKPLTADNKTVIFNAKVKDILDALDIKDIEEYISSKKEK